MNEQTTKQSDIHFGQQPCMRGITRIDQEPPKHKIHNHGWWVRLSTKTDPSTKKRNPSIHKFFSDKKHGGKVNALANAISYRNEMVSVHNITFLKKSGIKQLDKAKREKSQKENGKDVIFLGTGKDAALKAKQLGASDSTIWRIFSGRQNSFKVAMLFRRYEVQGFSQSRVINQQTYNFCKSVIKEIDRNLSKLDVDELAQRIILDYATITEKIVNEEAFLVKMCTREHKRYILNEKARVKNLRFYHGDKTLARKLGVAIEDD